jgi:hypothetical protein
MDYMHNAYNAYYMLNMGNKTKTLSVLVYIKQNFENVFILNPNPETEIYPIFIISFHYKLILLYYHILIL